MKRFASSWGGLLIMLGLFVASCLSAPESQPSRTRTVPVGKGWAQTSVNAVIFRKNALVSFGEHQYTAYYDSLGRVVLAQRKLETNDWQTHLTQYSGKVADAHNSISLMVDGSGYLHMAWDHHNDTLRYVKSIAPESLELGQKQLMLGLQETKVTYPEFHAFPNGDLLFAYRDGQSGNGNLMLNYYDHQKRQWSRLQSNLIDGEGQRNAYWQLYPDDQGTLHISWVWRESPDVASNHDMCYARSRDGGQTWERSDGSPYALPITMATAEVVKAIPQNHNLTNQTSMTADPLGNPYIATYFQDEGDSLTQIQVIYQTANGWQTSRVSDRQTPFVLAGAGTRSVPISRPQVMTKITGDETWLYLVYRDEELGNRAVLASAPLGSAINWRIEPITDYSTERWEPTFDTELWRREQQLHLFMQVVQQQNQETPVATPPTMVSVLEVEN